MTFDDAFHGPLTQRPAAQCGDLLLRDRLGNWTYQFAVAVDDMAQGIDLVVRGDDLLASTGRQILLARHLGRPAPPLYAHHPLVMKSPGQKLSKRDHDSGVRDLRAAGWTRPTCSARRRTPSGWLPARPTSRPARWRRFFALTAARWRFRSNG